MKPSYVLIHVLIVVAVVFGYDQLRDDEPREPPDALPAAPASPLEGGAVDTRDLEAAIDSLARRVNALERAAADRLAPPDRPDAPPTAARPPPSVPDPGSVDVPPAAPEVRETFSDEEIARFRALQAAAQRRARLETMRKHVGRLLDKVRVNLTAEERGQIVGEALRAWVRAEAVRGRQEADAAVGTALRLRADFREGVLQIVRGSHAEAIVDQLAPALGLHAASFQIPDDARSDGR